MYRIRHLTIALRTYIISLWTGMIKFLSWMTIKILKITKRFRQTRIYNDLEGQIRLIRPYLIALKNYVGETIKYYRQDLIQGIKVILISIGKELLLGILFLLKLYDAGLKRKKFHRKKLKNPSILPLAETTNIPPETEISTEKWKPPTSLAEVSLPSFTQIASLENDSAIIAPPGSRQSYLYKISDREETQHREQKRQSYWFIHVLWVAPLILLLHTNVVLAPPTPALPFFINAQSVEQLYQARDHLTVEINRFVKAVNLNSFKNSAQYEVLFQRYSSLLQDLESVEGRIQVEKKANASWKKAADLAIQALNLSKLPQQSAQTWQQKKLLWKQALNYLSQIPPESFLGKYANKKFGEYETYLAIATTQLAIAKSDILRQIANQSGLAPEVMISVCNLTRECLQISGDRIPKSAASLSKVPIAIALLEKVATENINMETPILVSAGNYTEDASDIHSGESYSLQQLLTDMITESSNIAPNQLIDYLGWDYINQVLQQHGYHSTRISSKFMGENTMPTDVGWQNNSLTTNELTEMMLEIYNRELPGADFLVNILNHQHDHDLGFAALQGSTAKWLGEKTGQNADVLGTTVAMEITGKIYILTVIDDVSYNEVNMRNCINQIATYIAKNGNL